VEETEISLQDISKILKRRYKLILSLTLISALMALGVSLLIHPTYQSDITLRIQQSKGLSDSLLSRSPVGNVMAASQQLSTYAEILKSRTVVEKVIKETQSGKPKLPTYEGFVRRITVSPVKDTEIMDVSVKDKSPEKAQEIANMLVKSFIERITTLSRSEQKEVGVFLAHRLKEQEKELDKAEAALEKYKSTQKMLSPEAQTQAIMDKMSTIDKLAAENKVALSASQAKLSTAEEQLGQEKPGFVADSPLVQQYKGKLADLEVQLVGLLQKYTENHPQVKETKAAIEETRNKLNAEAARIVNSEASSTNPVHQELLQSKIQAEAEIAATNAQNQAIQQVLAQGEGELAKLPAKEQGLAKVMRDVSVAQDIFTMLAQRHEEARISEVMTPINIQVIDQATLPEKPIGPKVPQNTAIGLILGLMLSIFLAFILEFFNRTIENQEDIQEYLALPVLGSIPNFDQKRKRRGRKEKDYYA